MPYLMPDSLLIVEARPAETYRSIRANAPTGNAFAKLRFLEYLLSAAPDDGSPDDAHRVNTLRQAFALAYGDFQLAAFEVAAGEFLERVKKDAANGDDVAEGGVHRWPRDRQQRVESVHAKILSWLAAGPARAAFNAANKLRALRSNMAKLVGKQGVTVNDVYAVAALAAGYSARKLPSPEIIELLRGELDLAGYFSATPEVHAAVLETLDALESRGIVHKVAPRSRQPLAERRAYMRDYMKAYRDRRKAAKAASPAASPAEAEAIDPLS